MILIDGSTAAENQSNLGCIWIKVRGSSSKAKVRHTVWISPLKEHASERGSNAFVSGEQGFNVEDNMLLFANVEMQS